jgi:hypothetical protein
MRKQFFSHFFKIAPSDPSHSFASHASFAYVSLELSIEQHDLQVQDLRKPILMPYLYCSWICPMLAPTPICGHAQDVHNP